jgi:Mn-dependent DtxR family transcriptional regulator
MSEDNADPEVHRLEHVLDEEVLCRLEVLVEFATSSQAWLRRLHHRIDQLTRRMSKDAEIAVGTSSVHGGLSEEKQSS